MKKSLAILSVLLLVLTLFGACANTGDTTTAPGTSATTTAETEIAKAKTEIKLGFLAGPSGLGGAYLLSQNEAGATINSYSCTIESDPKIFTASLLNGDVDIAAVPANAAATLFAKSGGKVQLLAVSTLGVLHILDRSGSVSSIGDLSGKTVLSAGQGTTTEYVLKYLLEKNGLTVGEAGSGADVTVVYATDHAEVVTLTQTEGSTYDIVLLPEPFVSKIQMTDSSFRSVIDLTSEWDKLGNGKLTMGAVAVRTSFASENPQAVADFLTDYKASIEFTNSNTAEAAALAGKYEILASAVAEKAIPNCNITFLAGKEMQTAVTGYLQVLFESDAASVGGAMPTDAFWFIAE